MKVLFVVRAGNHPATRLRVIQYLGHLKDAHIDSEVMPFPTGLLSWWDLLRKAKESDIVFFQKKRVHKFWLKRLKANGLKLIYDFDDAIMFNSPKHSVQESPLRMSQFISMITNCHGIIAGNSYLRAWAEPHNKNIWILPTPADTDKYTARLPAADDKNIILGWIGGKKTLPFLKSLQPVLDRIFDRHQNISLKIVSNSFFKAHKMPIMNKVWAEEDEAKDVSSFDVGLSPLPDDPWTRGKCAAKLLQYMASGVPPVASPVGIHNDIIQEGLNGFLAKNDEEWVDKICRLIEDKTLRYRMGAAARETTEKSYSVKATAPKIIEILKAVRELS